MDYSKVFSRHGGQENRHRQNLAKLLRITQNMRSPFPVRLSYIIYWIVFYISTKKRTYVENAKTMHKSIKEFGSFTSAIIISIQYIIIFFWLSPKSTFNLFFRCSFLYLDCILSCFCLIRQKQISADYRYIKISQILPKW